MDSIWLLQLFVSLFLTFNVHSNRTFPIGDPRACDIDTKAHYIFEVLPGLGWDNLVNENRGVVVNYNYSKCKTTEDRRYLIPDGVVTIPIKTSRMNVFSKMYDHWSKYETDTSFSINTGGSASFKGIGISASFSSEFEHVKSHQIEDKSLTTKVQARYVRYTAKVLPDAQLDPSFRLRLLKIANHIQHNRKSSARYESELLVRDFGTHVLTSIDAGASIVKVDQVKSSLLEDKTMNKFTISLAASVSILSLISVHNSEKFSITKTQIDKYMKQVTDSDIRTYGGPALNPENFTLGKWASEIDNDLVPVDRNGFPLDHFITTTALPELSESLVQELTQSIRTAIMTYYKHNTYPGCTDTDAPNFSFIANVEDGSCHAPFTNLSFGGVFQTCEFEGQLINNEDLCSKLRTKNPKTQDYSCQSGYEQTLLHTSETSKSQHTHTCHSCWIFFTCCHDHSYHGTAKYTSYWCQAPKDAKVPQDSGYLFGGLYSDKTNNFVTQSQSCPQYYLPMTITANIHVCVSDDYEQGTKSAIPFGGFYSCTNGNPMASANQVLKACHHGYSNHLATIDNDCEIMYCAQTGALSELKFPRVQLPPFTGIPAESIETPANYIISHDGQSWMQLIDPATKNHEPEENKWTTLQSAHAEMRSLLKTFEHNHVKYSVDEGMSKGAVAGLSVGVTTAVCLVVGVFIIIRRSRKQTDTAEYRSIH
ncbi:macrophage-expressed gene 1 protein-like [Mytilus galloprovincialis]|uniref:macrophage-expressed gene 1 protein-like n=1 Tax=Mytilus galloprovincialis TaxID=29158 RepID=UPI003F7BA4EC